MNTFYDKGDLAYKNFDELDGADEFFACFSTALLMVSTRNASNQCYTDVML